MGLSRVSEALAELGYPTEHPPPRPVLRGPSGTLLSAGLPAESGAIEWVGVWVTLKEIAFLGPVPAAATVQEFPDLTDPTRRLAQMLGEVARACLERTEEADASLGELQQRGRAAPLAEVWRLKRGVAAYGALIGRALVVLAECEGPLADRFAQFDRVADSLKTELARVRALLQDVQSGTTDLLLLRSAEESNQIAEMANELGRISNRIAAVANTSNVRMLGVSYLAFILALIAAIVLIPNTGGTILGMPSAAWVPGIWVDVILVVLAVVPMYIIFRQRWVWSVLRELRDFEGVAVEGVRDIPERVSTEPRA